MYSVSDLNNINDEIRPLKELSDRELQSIYGLSGEVYTPHIDTYNKVSIKKAKILSYLKKNGVLPFTEVETISAKLMVLHRKAKNGEVVEYDGYNYECQFSPLKLSKTGKVVRKWAKYWLKKTANDETDKEWENHVREIWPENFTIRNFDF